MTSDKCGEIVDQKVCLRRAGEQGLRVKGRVSLVSKGGLGA